MKRIFEFQKDGKVPEGLTTKVGAELSITEGGTTVTYASTYNGRAKWIAVGRLEVEFPSSIKNGTWELRLIRTDGCRLGVCATGTIKSLYDEEKAAVEAVGNQSKQMIDSPAGGITNGKRVRKVAEMKRGDTLSLNAVLPDDLPDGFKVAAQVRTHCGKLLDTFEARVVKVAGQGMMLNLLARNTFMFPIGHVFFDVQFVFNGNIVESTPTYAVEVVPDVTRD